MYFESTIFFNTIAPNLVGVLDTPIMVTDLGLKRAVRSLGIIVVYVTSDAVSKLASLVLNQHAVV